MNVAQACARAGTGLRILVVSSDTYPPSRVDVSVLFGQELSRRGHQVDWILQSERPCTSAYVTSWGGGRVWVGPTDLGTSLFNRIRKHLRGIVHDLKLFSLLRGGGYDFIEIKDKYISGIFAVFAARLHRTKFVYWLSYPFAEDYLLRARDGTARYPLLYFIRGAVCKFLLYRVLMPAAAHNFVQSEQMRRDIVKEGIAEDRMTVVPMGIQQAAFEPAQDGARRQCIPAGERCIVYLGTLSRVRRLDFLVRVLALVIAEVPDAKLYFVGGGDDPSDMSFLLEQARRSGVEGAAVFVGKLPHADALRYVREADVCVSPFYPTPVNNSTSPTKLVEYLAMGKAVVANDHPEQRLVIEQSGGGYCVPYEERAFAAAIVKLLEAPETAAAMGKRGRQYALEHRSYAKIADLVEATLTRIADGHSASDPCG
jgi:glycosyltransferase involved in cell wall biosynthesis